MEYNNIRFKNKIIINLLITIETLGKIWYKISSFIIQELLIF